MNSLVIDKQSFLPNQSTQPIEIYSDKVPDLKISSSILNEMGIIGESVFLKQVRKLEVASATPSFKYKVLTLETTVQQLEIAQKNKTKDRIIAFLKAALYVTVVVAGVLGTMALAATGNPAAIGLGFVTFIACYALNAWYTCEFQEGRLMNSSNNGAELTLGMLVSPFFPLWDAFTKIRNLELCVKSQKKEIAEKFSQGVEFFANTDHSEFLNALDEQTKKLAKQISELEALSPALLSELNSTHESLKLKKATYEKVAQDLKANIDFYKQTVLSYEF
ncbi:MAG: hypothetical protein WCF65_04170 [Parachlamydiaceae bacterium]